MKTIRELLEDGTITMDTKVLGTLPMTADGCVVGDGASVWYSATEKWHVSELMRSPAHNESGWRPYYTGKSYGERPAAARKEGV